MSILLLENNGSVVFMLGYYNLDKDMIEKLPVGSRNIKENIYDLCCPLVIKDRKNIPPDLLCLYETLEIPVISYDEIEKFDFDQYNEFCEYLKDFSKYLKLNVDIEKLEEGEVGHLLRVSKNARDLCMCLGISKEQTKDIYIASLFHDVGKYKVPSSIVGKKGRLSEKEFELIKKHCDYSYDILKDFLPQKTLNAVRSHHERCDGSGYPDGIVPSFDAKIIGIVDSFDAMTSDRVYQKQKSIKEALDELFLCGKTVEEGGKGKLFDGEIVSKFIEMINGKMNLEQETII